jgi:methylmalonyl-CoA/ethylmalonyl-CoA epimerase
LLGDFVDSPGAGCDAGNAIAYALESWGDLVAVLMTEYGPVTPGGMPMVQNIDHVVIAVNDLNEGMAQYEKTFGLKPSRTGERPDDGFKNAFYDLPGGGFLELVQPTDATGPVAKGLAARGEGVYLMALAVEDIEAEVAAMRERGVRLIGDPGPGQPISRVVFVHPRETKGVLVQLVQRKPGM